MPLQSLSIGKRPTTSLAGFEMVDYSHWSHCRNKLIRKGFFPVDPVLSSTATPSPRPVKSPSLLRTSSSNSRTTTMSHSLLWTDSSSMMSHSSWTYSSVKMSRCSTSKKSLQANRCKNGSKEMITRHHIVGVDLIISSHFRDPPMRMDTIQQQMGLLALEH